MRALHGKHQTHRRRHRSIGTSASWAPGADFTLQGLVPVSTGKAVIELQVRFDASMDWSSFDSFRPSTEPLFMENHSPARMSWKLIFRKAKTVPVVTENSRRQAWHLKRRRRISQQFA
jgi:hypothetical protein